MLRLDPEEQHAKDNEARQTELRSRDKHEGKTRSIKKGPEHEVNP